MHLVCTPLPLLPPLLACVCPEGTYGIVFRARCKSTGKIYALKKLKMENCPDGFPQTSVREVNVLLSLHHPNIVNVSEVRTHGPGSWAEGGGVLELRASTGAGFTGNTTQRAILPSDDYGARHEYGQSTSSSRSCVLVCVGGARLVPCHIPSGRVSCW